MASSAALPWPQQVDLCVQALGQARVDLENRLDRENGQCYEETAEVVSKSRQLEACAMLMKHETRMLQETVRQLEAQLLNAKMHNNVLEAKLQAIQQQNSYGHGARERGEGNPYAVVVRRPHPLQM